MIGLTGRIELESFEKHYHHHEPYHHHVHHPPPPLTGYSLSEAFIFSSINPKYDNRLFVELQVQYKKTTSYECVASIKLFRRSKQQQNNLMCATWTELVVFLYWTCNSTNKLLSHFGLIDAKMRASDKE